MSESKSLLARLLAKENITVQHGNYTTAYFDVQNRILGLPLWRNDNKDLHDMLVGHEVGHALYTPAEGWVDMQKAAGDERVPGDYLNVVEDIRIERMIQNTYPGIVRSFKRGYTYLHESDFFGIADRKINAMGLMDRINLKAKLRDLIDVEFSETEQPLVDRAFAVNTWDEVVASARELYEFVKNNPESQNQENNTTQADVGGSKAEDDSDEELIDPSGGDGDEEETNDDQESTHESAQTDPGCETEDRDNACEQRANSDSQESDEGEKGSSREGGAEGLDGVETYRNAQENATELLDTNEKGEVPLVVHGMYREQMKEMIVPFEKVRKARETAKENVINEYHKISERYPDRKESCNRRLEEMNTDTDHRYREFITETKRVVNVMAKEFELRKAAYQYSRASTSRSGSLDLQRLHEYKTSDDIFSRVTTLADAKSHGMVMLIDNSASMYEERGPVIRQVLNLAMFCKRVNIPFDVYSFTNTRFIDPSDDDNVDGYPIEALNHKNAMLTHVLSSSFKRRDYDIAYRQLFDLSVRTEGSEGYYDRMSGTPLDDILTGMHMILKDFKNKYQIERPIFTVLTDGDSNQLNIRSALINKHMGLNRKGVRILLDESRQIISPKGRIFRIGCMSEYLYNAIRREVPGLKIIGYFVATTNDEFKRQVYRATGEYDYDNIKEARKLANRDKFVAYDNTMGYDRYFLLKAVRSSDLDTSDDEFEVSDKAKRGEITRAFKKYTKSKKGNRVLATQFAEIIS